MPREFAPKAGKTIRIRVPLLMYHWFAEKETGSRSPQLEIHPDLFETHLDWLSGNGYRTVTLSALHDHIDHGAPLPPRPVVITFDDGTADFGQHAWPALRKHGFTATLFVVAGRVGGTNQWDQALGEPVRKLHDWDELRTLQGEGLEIGSHTVTHPDLSTLSENQAREELVRSKEILEEELGKPVEFLAYPFGRFDEITMRLAVETGYRGACAVLLKLSDLLRSHRYCLRRITVKGQDRGVRFRMRFSAGTVRHKVTARDDLDAPALAGA